MKLITLFTIIILTACTTSVDTDHENENKINLSNPEFKFNYIQEPGFYGPTVLTAKKVYIYTLVVPSGIKSLYPNGNYSLSIYEGWNSWRLLKRYTLTKNSTALVFPDEIEHPVYRHYKRYRIVFEYSNQSRTFIYHRQKNIIVHPDE